MPEVTVEISGRKYRMACEEGQQQHLANLAMRFNGQVEALRQGVGEIGDGRLVVMAGIAVVDELSEAERRIAALESQVRELTSAGEALSADLDRLEARFAGRLVEAAKRLEAVATEMDQAAVP